YMTPDNTNVAESCHANINCNGKVLSLYNTILKISNSGKNQSIIAREKRLIKKTVEIDLIEDLSSQTSSSLNHQEYQLTLKECELAIKERELKLEKEKLELAKLRRELSLNGLND
ncbi:17106_t:CDS:2, partial [Dentiscutata erythropus]